MSIFGAAFQSGAAVVMIGAVGQIFNCAVGSVGFLLLMSGNQAPADEDRGGQCGVDDWAERVLVPRLGIAGAAIATTITTVITNVWALISVRRMLKDISL